MFGSAATDRRMHTASEDPTLPLKFTSPSKAADGKGGATMFRLLSLVTVTW